MFATSHFATLAVYALVCLVASVVSLIMPIETKGRALLQVGQLAVYVLVCLVPNIICLSVPIENKDGALMNVS